MKAKAIKKVSKPRIKKSNVEPEQPKPELNYQELVKECEKWSKMA